MSKRDLKTGFYWVRPKEGDDWRMAHVASVSHGAYWGTAIPGPPLFDAAKMYDIRPAVPPTD